MSKPYRRLRAKARCDPSPGADAGHHFRPFGFGENVRHIDKAEGGKTRLNAEG